MKKIINCLLVFMPLVIVLSSCDPNAAKKEQLKKYVDETQAGLPLSLGSLGELTNVSYADDMVTFSYFINEDIFEVSSFIEDSVMVKENFQCLVARDNDMQKMVKEIAAADASLVLKYKGKTTGKVLSFTISNKELSNTDKFILTSIEAANKLVENNMRMEHKSMPMNLGNGMKLSNSFWEGDNLVYPCALDGSIYSLEIMRKANKDDLKQSVLAGITSETSTKVYIEALITLRRNICYRYQIEGTSNHMDILISTSELKDMLELYKR